MALAAVFKGFIFWGYFFSFFFKTGFLRATEIKGNKANTTLII